MKNGIVLTLCKAKKIWHGFGSDPCKKFFWVDCSDGTITGLLKPPRQGLKLKNGDLIIRHNTANRTLAIDKVVKIDEYGHFQIMRVFGKIKEVPSLKGKYIDLDVFCF